MPEGQPTRQVAVLCRSSNSPLLRECVEVIAAELPYWRLLVVAAEESPQPKPPDGRPGVMVPDLSLSTLGGVSLHRVGSLPGPAMEAVLRGNELWAAVLIGADATASAIAGRTRTGAVEVTIRQAGLAGEGMGDGAKTSEVSVRHVAPDGHDTSVWRQRLVPARFATREGTRLELEVLACALLRSVLRELDAREGALSEEMERCGLPEVQWLLDRSGPPSPQSATPGTHVVARRLRNGIKGILMAGFVYLWVPLRNLLRRATGTCHAMVLLYHRVDDEYRDSVTVGVEQFCKQLDLLRRRYTVLDLPELLATRDSARRRPCVAVTFDDGYADNYLAAKLLRRAAVPCTFFLSTRIVGTDAAFPHDLKRLGRRIPPLNWAQVKEMAHWGFHFGPHTAYHPNLATLSTEEAMQEITLSRADLLERLGPSGGESWFAYPHGRPEDVPEEIRRAMPDCGIVWCFSAYGGVNRPGFDSLNVRRQGVDWGYSTLAFRAVLEGWPVRLPPRRKQPSGR